MEERPPAGADAPRRTTLAGRMPVLLLALLGTLAGLKNTDTSIVSITLPDASEAFDLSAGMQAFAASVGTLALAASAMPIGIVSDRIGRRRTLIISLFILLAGELLTIVAPDAALFVLGRAVAGIGLGGAFATSFALVPAVAPGRLTPGALGIWNATMMPMALALQMAGSLLALVDWRLAYLTLPLVAVPLLVLSRATLPETVGESRPADPPGLIAIASAILVFLSGISLLADQTHAAGAWACLAAGVALFGVWILLEKRSRHPSFPVGLLRERVFLGAVIAGLIFMAALGLLTLQLANFWEYLLGYDAVQVTLGLLPITVVAAAVSLLVGRWLTRGVSPALLMPVGLLVCAAGFFCLLPVNVHSPYMVFVPAILLATTGVGLATVSQSKVFVTEAPPGFVGAVTSSRVTFGQLGTSIGMALGLALVAIGANVDFARLLADAGVDPVRAGTALTDVQQYAALQNGQDVTAARDVVLASAQAYAAGFRLLMLAFAVICLIGAVAVWLLPRSGRRRRP